MERIGIAASKIAKGNIFLYNFYVVVISFLFSLFVFFVAGSSIMLALIVIGYVVNGVLPNDLSEEWMNVTKLCMVTLTAVVGIINIFAILRNFKVKDR